MMQHTCGKKALPSLQARGILFVETCGTALVAGAAQTAASKPNE